MTRISNSGPDPRDQQSFSSHSHSSRAVPTPTSTRSSRGNPRTAPDSSPPRARTFSYDSEIRSNSPARVSPGGRPTENAPVVRPEMSRETPHTGTGVRYLNPTQPTQYPSREAFNSFSRQDDNMAGEFSQSNGCYPQADPRQAAGQYMAHPRTGPRLHAPNGGLDRSYQLGGYLPGLEQREPMASGSLGPDESILPDPPSPPRPLVPQAGRRGSQDRDVAYAGGWYGAADAFPSSTTGQLGGFDS